MRRLQLHAHRFGRLGPRLQFFLELTQGAGVFLERCAHRDDFVRPLLRHLFAGLRVRSRSGKLIAQLRDRACAALELRGTRCKLRPSRKQLITLVRQCEDLRLGSVTLGDDRIAFALSIA